MAGRITEKGEADMSLHGNTVCRSCTALVDWKKPRKGCMSAIIAYNLDNNSAFRLSDMRKMVMAEDKNVKKISFLAARK